MKKTRRRKKPSHQQRRARQRKEGPLFHQGVPEYHYFDFSKNQMHVRPCCFLGIPLGGVSVMNIAVVQEDGTENEFELDMCCRDCAREKYGWSREHFEKVSKMDEPIKIPDNVTTVEQFKQFVKSI